MKTRWVAVFALAVGVGVLLVGLGTPPVTSADPASELVAAEESVSAASAQMATNEQTVEQAKKTFEPIKAQTNRALAAAKAALAHAKTIGKELTSERVGAAKQIASAEANYQDEKSSHDTTTGVGIGLAVAAALLALGAFVFGKFRKWPLSKRLTQVLGGVLGISFAGGLVLAFVPSEPQAPQFSDQVQKLAADAKGNPLRPPTPELVKATLAVKPLLAKAKALEIASRQPGKRLEEAESNASHARSELADAKRKVNAAQAAVGREEKIAAEESAFKEEATTIDYKQLIKNADAYKGEKVVYRGQIFQIQESVGESIILLAVTDEGYGFWNNNIWVDYAGSIEAAEEAIITIYGTVTGSKEYETQAGGSTYVPRIRAKYIEE